jgi:steroid delta-isomerase-like uncharacterized protein
MTEAERLIRAYYAAFNTGDRRAMCAMLTPDVAHDVNQGERRTGLDAFRAFLARMDASYVERVEDLVVLTEPTGTRAAAEFLVVGQYIATDEGLPAAHGQRYVLPACAFFDIRAARIARVATHYNLRAWIAQVTQGA